MLNSSICVDASFLVRLLIYPDPDAPQVKLWERWHEEGRNIIAPTLVFYEVVNALHRYAVHGELDYDDVVNLLSVVLEFDIELYGDSELHKRALEIANELHLSTTYDAHYLALSERMGVEFWTADKRLVNAVKGKLSRIHLI